MKRILVATAALVWPAMAFAEVPALCADAPNQMEATACATRKLATATAALAQANDALAAKLDPLGRRNLNRAQSAWQAYRDLECNLETGYDAENIENNGTLMPMLVGECAVNLTDKRIRELKSQMKCPGGDLSCTP